MSYSSLHVEIIKKKRDLLVAKINMMDKCLYPDRDSMELLPDQWDLLRKQYNKTLNEYYTSLPKIMMSMCPYCGEKLAHTFDPFGLDGPWWFPNQNNPHDYSSACRHFKVLLGAFKTSEEGLAKVKEEVRPGPDVPFVVPAMLDLEGMVAVISKVELTTKEVAYPIAYFSNRPTDHSQLHQPWRKREYWFRNESNHLCWFISNDTWEFDLTKYIDKGKIFWTRRNDDTLEISKIGKNDNCPYLNLSGKRSPQILRKGDCWWLPSPNGKPISPYGD